MKTTTRKTALRRSIATPLDRVWSVVSSGQGLYPCCPDVSTSGELDGCGFGAARRCTLADGSGLVECVVEMDHDEHYLAFVLMAHPLPADNIVASLQVTADDPNVTRIVWEAQFTAPEHVHPEVLDRLHEIYAQGLDNLTRHCLALTPASPVPGSS